jgi:hypothetical protein
MRKSFFGGGRPWPAAFTASRMTVLAVTAGLALALPVAVSVPAAASAPAGAPGLVTTHFVWTAGGANTSFDSAYIVNGATNGRPGDLVFVTPNFKPGGACGCIYEPHPIGVWYDRNAGEWAVFNEDQGPMPVGESFNVLVVPRASGSVFVQTATPSNYFAGSIFINSPFTNGNPSARIQVTQNWNPGGIGGTYNGHAVGVWYSTSRGEWALFNEDGAPIPIGAAFNVMVGSRPSNGGRSAVVKTTSSNQSGDATSFNNARTTSNPSNVTFITQNWNPGGVGGVANPAQTGAWYVGPLEAVFNEDQSAPPLGSAFNLLIFSS